MQSEELNLVDGLVQLSFLVHETLSAVGAEHHLSIPQIRLLGILRDREPSMTGLAQHLGLDRSSVTGLIDRAQDRGLVTRLASAHDGRGVHVRLTARGRRVCMAAEADVAAAIAALCSELSPAEEERLRRLATKVVTWRPPGPSSHAL
jgi:MarR family transcriptional regulator, lower aerobic nicotinate degradation pathway regulator